MRPTIVMTEEELLAGLDQLAESSRFLLECRENDLAGRLAEKGRSLLERWRAEQGME